MRDPEYNPSWLSRRLESAFKAALTRAYHTVGVSSEAYLKHLRTAHRVPVSTYDGLFSISVTELDSIAWQTIRGAMKIAAAEGAGLGFGGFVTIAPDMGILAAITMRTVQKLSLIYGFQFNTDEEIADLWIAAATAAGVDISKDLLEKTLLKAFVRRVIGRIAKRVGAEFAEKMTARSIPVLSSAVGAVLNYYFVRAWSKRALIHFRERHLDERSRRATLSGVASPAPASNR